MVPLLFRDHRELSATWSLLRSQLSSRALSSKAFCRPCRLPENHAASKSVNSLISSLCSSAWHVLPHWWHLWLRETLAHLSWSRIWLQLLTIGLPSASSLASCGNRIATLRLRQVLVSSSAATGNQKRSASTSPSCLGLTGDKGTFPRQQFPKCGATQSRRRLRFGF